jgi:two-component system sensor histidine kinase BarA
MRGSTRQSSIRRKLMLIALGGVAVTSLIAMVITGWRYIAHYTSSHHEEFLQTAEVLAMVVSEPLAQGERTRVARGLAAISRLPRFTYARVTDTEGRLVAELGSAVVLVTDKYMPLPLRSKLQVVADVVYGGRRIGQLMLVGDNSELRRELLGSLLAVFVSALLSSVVGTWVAGRMQRRITEPLVELAGAMQLIRETQDFSHPVASHSDDEMGQLVAAFNEMQRHIRQRDRRLAEHAQNLEHTVELRTHELVAARNAAERANAAKSDFLATMSHEIRTPMNGMLVMAELLSTAALSPQHHRYAEVIVKSGHGLLGIINDILDFSKIESGKLELEQVAFDVNAVVDDVLALYFQRAAAKGLDIAGHVAPEVPQLVAGDPVRLSQVLANLVNNALKFTSEGGVFIELELLAPEGGQGNARLAFAVADSGIGIPEDKQSSIFDAFSQADQSTTRRFGGTGLGLAICKKLVGAMGGAIELESRPGEGSRFGFTLDLPVAGEGEPRALLLCSRLARALVISDGEASDEALALYLGDHGVDPLVIADVGAAAAIVAQADVVFARAEPLADLNLLIEALPAGKRPYLVCLVPIGDAEHEPLVRAGLADDIIAKPLARGDFEQLMERLDAGRPRRAAALDSVAVAAPQGVSFAGARILVADDSPVNREVAIEALKRLDIACETVVNGAEAVEAMARGGFDAVLMDCSMPVMDGFAATSAIRRRERERGQERVPVIALTAHVAGLPAHDWQQAGMDAYLAKPFRLAELTEVLGQFLQPVAATAASPDIPAAADASTPEPAQVADVPVLDEAVLAAYGDFQADGAAELIGRLFNLFMQHAPAAFAEIEQQAGSDDGKALAAAAHALKSMGRNIGAARLCAACERLELAARQGTGINAAEALRQIGGELDRVRQLIRARQAA